MTPEWIQAVGLFHYPYLVLFPTHFPSITFSIFPPHSTSLISSIPPTGLFYPGPPFTSHFSPPLLFLKVKLLIRFCSLAVISFSLAFDVFLFFFYFIPFRSSFSYLLHPLALDAVPIARLSPLLSPLFLKIPPIRPCGDIAFPHSESSTERLEH